MIPPLHKKATKEDKDEAPVSQDKYPTNCPAKTPFKFRQDLPSKQKYNNKNRNVI